MTLENIYSEILNKNKKIELATLCFPEIGNYKNEINLPVYKTFKEISLNNLIALKGSVAMGIIRENEIWMEKIFRFVEVNQGDFKSKFTTQFGKQSVEAIALLCSIFIDYYYYAADLRYVNSVLKIIQLFNLKNNTIDYETADIAAINNCINHFRLTKILKTLAN